MIELAARYIGSLPGAGEPAEYVDHQPLPVRRVQMETVQAGSGEQGRLGMFFTNELEPVLEDRVSARLLELVLAARLRERIREQLGDTYTITATIDLQREPDTFSEASIISTGDPVALQEISLEVLADLAALQADGPTDAEFATAVEQLGDELQLIDNRLLATGLITAHLYPDQPVAELAERFQVLEDLTADDVRELAEVVFDLDQRIEVRQVPRP
jgi:predicted Zn-dependent peptidase